MSDTAYDSLPLVEFEGQRIYDVLVARCGAPTDLSSRTEWAAWWPQRDNLREFRFIGLLGFGGKFWSSGAAWYVNCYREHETPERLAMIAAANERLAELRKEYDDA